MENQTPIKPTTEIPINPVLLECMNLLKEIRVKIDDYYKTNTSYHDIIVNNYISIDGDINAIASDISHIMGYEMLSKCFYQEKGGNNE